MPCREPPAVAELVRRTLAKDDLDRAFRRAARSVLGPALADAIERTLLLLEDTGRERLGDERMGRLRERFSAFDHPAAREILAWLDGHWIIGTEDLETQ